MRVSCNSRNRLAVPQRQVLHSVQPLLASAVDDLEQFLTQPLTEPTLAWLREFADRLEPIDQLAAIWVHAEQEEMLARVPVEDGDEALRQLILRNGRQLLLQCGTIQLRIGGLPYAPPSLTRELVAECRVTGWRIVVTVAILQAFCDEWRQGAF